LHSQKFISASKDPIQEGRKKRPLANFPPLCQVPAFIFCFRQYKNRASAKKKKTKFQKNGSKPNTRRKEIEPAN
jgi:hypothetical protein